MTISPGPVLTTCAWCSGALAGNGPMEIWEVGTVRYRTGPLGPRKRRYRVNEAAGHRAACGHCAPLVHARDFAALATRAVIQAAGSRDQVVALLAQIADALAGDYASRKTQGLRRVGALGQFG